MRGIHFNTSRERRARINANYLLTVQPAPETAASPATDTATLIVLLFRACARQLRRAQWLLNGRRPDIDPAVLERERLADGAADAELQRRYPDASSRMHDLQLHARARGIWVAPRTPPEQLAALLDYLDYPQRLEPLGPISSRMMMIALNTAALDAAGNTSFSMAYPVNRARYQLVCGHARRTNTQDGHYNNERAGWSTAQWLEHEQEETERWRAVSARALARGRPQLLAPRSPTPRCEPPFAAAACTSWVGLHR